MTYCDITLEQSDTPKYRALADGIAAEIRNGKLKAGTQLPTHRELAFQFGVTVGTVTRAYAELARRNLISGEVGRGSFVRPAREMPSGLRSLLSRSSDNPIDLALNRPSYGPHAALFADALRDLADDDTLLFRLDFEMAGGHPQDKAAAAEWLAGRGVPATPETIIVTAGCQHAIDVALSAVLRPGDTLLTDCLTWPGALGTARRGLRVRGIAMDDEGVVPDALAAACVQTSARALYLMPTLQNPTTAVMSEERRRAVADIAERHDLYIIEDDVLGFLQSGHTPLAALLPQRTLYVTSVSKCLLPALRIGYMSVPASLYEPCLAGVHLTTVMAPSPNAAITTRWLNDGTAKQLIEWQRHEQEARHAIAQKALRGLEYRTSEFSFHLWLTLPEGVDPATAVARARARGVQVTPETAFQAEADGPGNHLRISISAPRDRASLKEALSHLRAALNEDPHHAVI